MIQLAVVCENLLLLGTRRVDRCGLRVALRVIVVVASLLFGSRRTGRMTEKA